MKLASFALLLLLLHSCNERSTDTASGNTTAAPGDTITSPSGLTYIYQKKGDGPRILDGAKVSVYNRLYLNDSEELFWSTDDSKDSVFTFIQGKTPLIKGAKELYPQLREGDVVTAIMPDSIGYGKMGGSGVPPGTTLVFNPIIIKEVSQPKLVLGDSLYALVKRSGVQTAIDRYEEIASSGLREKYHMDLELLYDPLDRLAIDEDYEQLEEFAAYFEKRTSEKSDRIMFGYFKILAAEKLGNFQTALDYAQTLIQTYPEEQFFAAYKAQLERKLESQ